MKPSGSSLRLNKLIDKGMIASMPLKKNNKQMKNNCVMILQLKT
jgi:hypothetical protein